MINSAESAVVLDQIGDASSYVLGPGLISTPSQILSDFPGSSSMVLEDFTVSATSGLSISQVSVLYRADEGFSSFSSVTGYSVTIFSTTNAAATGLTGDVQNHLVLTGGGATVSQVAGFTGGFEYGLVRLDVSIALAAGTYWIGVTPQTNSAIGYFRLLAKGANVPVPAGNANAKLANPGLDLGVGAISALDADYAYKITVVPEPAVAALWLVGCWGWIFRRNRDYEPHPSRGV